MSKPEESDTIEVPIPGTSKSAKFTGATVFYSLLILVIGFILFYQLGAIQENISSMRKDISCKLDLDIYLYTRPQDQFRLREMPRDLFSCLPKWVGAPEVLDKK